MKPKLTPLALVVLAGHAVFSSAGCSYEDAALSETGSGQSEGDATASGGKSDSPTEIMPCDGAEVVVAVQNLGIYNPGTEATSVVSTGVLSMGNHSIDFGVSAPQATTIFLEQTWWYSFDKQPVVDGIVEMIIDSADAGVDILSLEATLDGYVLDGVADPVQAIADLESAIEYAADHDMLVVVPAGIRGLSGVRDLDQPINYRYPQVTDSWNVFTIGTTDEPTPFTSNFGQSAVDTSVAADYGHHLNTFATLPVAAALAKALSAGQTPDVAVSALVTHSIPHPEWAGRSQSEGNVDFEAYSQAMCINTPTR